MKRLIKVGLITLLALVVAFFFILSFMIDKLIHTGIETFGPKFTQTEIRLDEVSISPLNGSGSLKGFFIGNPEGFISDKAFYLGEIEIDLAPLSLFTERVLIERIYIKEPQIVFESSSSGNNLNQLLTNVNEVVTLCEGEEQEPMRIEVTEFILEDGRVEIIMLGRVMTVSLARIELRDIGKESGGITSDELAQAILSEVTGNVGRTVKNATGLAVETGVEVKDKVTEASEETMKGIKKLFNNMKKGK